MMEPLEKPKRTTIESYAPQPQYRKWLGLFLAGLLGLPIPLILLLQADQERTIDLLLIGVIICAGLYLVYQGFLWVVGRTMTVDEPIDMPE